MKVCIDCHRNLANARFAGRAKVCRECSDRTFEELKQRNRATRRPGNTSTSTSTNIGAIHGVVF